MIYRKTQQSWADINCPGCSTPLEIDNNYEDRVIDCDMGRAPCPECGVVVQVQATLTWSVIKILEGESQ